MCERTGVRPTVVRDRGGGTGTASAGRASETGRPANCPLRQASRGRARQALDTRTDGHPGPQSIATREAGQTRQALDARAKQAARPTAPCDRQAGGAHAKPWTREQTGTPAHNRSRHGKRDRHGKRWTRERNRPPGQLPLATGKPGARTPSPGHANRRASRPTVDRDTGSGTDTASAGHASETGRPANCPLRQASRGRERPALDARTDGPPGRRLIVTDSRGGRGKRWTRQQAGLPANCRS